MEKAILLLSLLLLLCSVNPSLSQLSFNFYGISCPAAEFMVKNTVRSVSSNDPSIPGKLLRLFFHDCFVQGCDASVLLQGNETERSDPANRSLGGFSVIDSAKRMLEIFCPFTVSCADILALAARDAVEFLGGPAVEIPTGRRDGKVSAVSDVRPNMVDTSFSLDQMIQTFSSKGLSINDLVTLSGAHTIGAAHCNAFSDRFRADTKGNLTFVDGSIDENYASQLSKQCPAGGSPSVTVVNDPSTPFLFDNEYYRMLLSRRGLFHSDSVLVIDDRTKGIVSDLANDQNRFFESWTQSFLRLSTIGVKTANQGQIRISCSSIN
ncbi:peroxidase 46-like [Impatiens glandulifera]|uniref:peroxidase 46-like n=1 Tax=Impatiens glandulifera TaxID=253017 RepID=UPI001FB0F901|nr:peroxidase 46-like [Impatiens glandulifera]